MTVDEIAKYLALALSSITFVGYLKSFFSSGEKTIAADLKKVDARLEVTELKVADHGSRLQTVENDMQHLPNREAFHRLELNMAGLSGHIEALKEQLKPIDTLSRRLQEILLEQAKK